MGKEYHLVPLEGTIQWSAAHNSPWWALQQMKIHWAKALYCQDTKMSPLSVGNNCSYYLIKKDFQRRTINLQITLEKKQTRNRSTIVVVGAYLGRGELHHTGLPAPSPPLQIYSLQRSSGLSAWGIFDASVYSLGRGPNPLGRTLSLYQWEKWSIWKRIYNSWPNRAKH